MEQVFFIADFHLGDHDVFTKDENGRRMNVNVAVRDNWLLDMWMSQVGKKDCVYILGDLMAYRGETGENLLSRLPGKKYLIEGNHDENLRAFPGQFRSVELMMNKVFSPMVYPFLKERLNVTMCHYPMYSWYRKPEGAVLLHGHSHGNLDEFNRNSLELKVDIGVEGELFQSIKRIPTLQDVYEFFMAKAEAFGMPTLALYARYCYRFKEARYNLEYSSEID